MPLISLAAGVDPRAAIFTSPDLKAPQASEIDTMTLLLESSASANAPDSVGDAPLWWAMSRPNPRAVQLLVSHGAVWPVEPENCRRFVYLLQRVTQRSLLKEIASALWPLLAEAEQQSSERGGLLGVAMAAGAVPLWLRLLGPGAVAASKEAAHRIHSGGDKSIVDEAAVAVSLLVSGPKAGPLETETKRAIGKENWLELEKNAASALLLKELRGAHEDDRDVDLDLVKMLLKKGASANTSQQASHLFKMDWDEEDYTPLVLLANACSLSSPSAASVVQLLVDHKADVEQVDIDGDNALAWAVMKQNSAVVEALVKFGAPLGPSLVEEEGSPLAAVIHPALLRPIASALGPTIRTALEDFPSPPLWLLVQFGTPEAVGNVLSKGTQPVRAAEVEALLRRRVQGGGLSGGALGGGSREDMRVASELKAAAIREAVANGGAEGPEAATRFWKTLLAEAATTLLRQEVEGAFDGTFSIDLGFVEALLSAGAEPNLQVSVGEDGDEAEEEDSEVDLGEDVGEEEEEEDEEEDDLEEEEEEHESSQAEGGDLESDADNSTTSPRREVV